jgi:hypothetical protein
VTARRLASTKDRIGVVIQIVSVGSIERVRRLPDRLPVKSVILLTVLEFLANAGAYQNLAICRVGGDIPVVEKSVQVAAHEDAVRDLMSPQK